MGSKTRSVEVAVAYGGDSGSWDTRYVDIPADTPEDKVEDAALTAVATEIWDAGEEYQHMWVYSLGGDGSDDDADDDADEA